MLFLTQLQIVAMNPDWSVQKQRIQRGSDRASLMNNPQQTRSTILGQIMNILVRGRMMVPNPRDHQALSNARAATARTPNSVTIIITT
jgi:hypothetical protein